MLVDVSVLKLVDFTQENSSEETIAWILWTIFMHTIQPHPLTLVHLFVQSFNEDYWSFRKFSASPRGNKPCSRDCLKCMELVERIQDYVQCLYKHIPSDILQKGNIQRKYMLSKSELVVHWTSTWACGNAQNYTYCSSVICCDVWFIIAPNVFYLI